MDMIKSAFIGLCFFIIFAAFAQEPNYLDLVKSESLLEDLFAQLYADSLSDRDQVLSSILEIMPEALSAEGAMDYPWKGLTRIGVVSSDDQMVRIFTWQDRKSVV